MTLSDVSHLVPHRFLSALRSRHITHIATLATNLPPPESTSSEVTDADYSTTPSRLDNKFESKDCMDQNQYSTNLSMQRVTHCNSVSQISRWNAESYLAKYV
jgi:hypothetical protein